MRDDWKIAGGTPALPNSMSASIETWAEQIRAGDVRAVSRAITAIEDHDPQAEDLLQRIFPAYRAVLCDWSDGRARNGEEHARRSAGGALSSAGESRWNYCGRSDESLHGRRDSRRPHSDARPRERPGHFHPVDGDARISGGLARTTGDVALVLDAAGKQYVLVETVGVGQDEVDIVRLADCTLVLLVPGMGDDVQNMKAGLMEIADIFVLNKSDREGVERLEAELEAMLQLAPERDGWKPTIVRTVATENKGVDELAVGDRQVPGTLRRQRGAPGTENRTLEVAASRARRGSCFEARGFRRGRRSRARHDWRAKWPAAERIPTQPFANCWRARTARGKAHETWRPGILAAHGWHVSPGRRRDVRRDPQADVGESCAGRRAQSNPDGHEFAADSRGGKMDSGRNRRGRQMGRETLGHLRI